MVDLLKGALSHNDNGLVFVYTGNGKGKTTAAMGQALRAVGHGFKVLVIQFMKGRKYGEVVAAEKYLPDITIHQCGLDRFVIKDDLKPDDIGLAQKGLNLAKKALRAGDYDMVILDELNVAVDFGLVSVQDVVEMIKSRMPSIDLVLTGRYAPQKIIELADTVSEFKEIKHHYAAGVTERAGIEF